MGWLENGAWRTGWGGTELQDGRFVRRDSVWRDWVTPDGAPGPSGAGGFAAESGRYHLYVSLACPWAHRVLIARAIKGLAPHIGVSVVHTDMGEDGWTFADQEAGAFGRTGDRLGGRRFLREVYLAADPAASGSVTVPVLWDAARGTIVSNESSEILRMFDTAFAALPGVAAPSLRPAALAAEIDALNAEIYERVNNGVYRAGFATTQAAYEEAVFPLFETLGRLEARLATRRYLTGDAPTEADWRLWTTLVRFDAVYVGHFKCNLRRLVEFPHLWAYARDLMAVPGVAETVHMGHIKRHYYASHESINPHRIVPAGPVVDWSEPHGRERLRAAA